MTLKHTLILLLCLLPCGTALARDEAGTTQGATPITFAANAGPSQHHPALACDEEDHCLLAWQQGTPYFASGATAIQAVALDGEGRPKTAAPTVIASDASLERPLIAYNQGVFLIVWQTLRDNVGWDIHGARMSRNGKLLDEKPFQIAGGAGNQVLPAIAFAPDGFLVVWQQFADDGYYRLHAARIGIDGKILNTEALRYQGQPLFGGEPSIGHDGRRWLFSWTNEKDWSKSNGAVGTITRWFARLDLARDGFSVIDARRAPTPATATWGGVLASDGTSGTLFTGWGNAGRGNEVSSGLLFGNDNMTPRPNRNEEKHYGMSGWRTEQVFMVFDAHLAVDGPITTRYGHGVYYSVTRDRVYERRTLKAYRLIGTQTSPDGRRLLNKDAWPVLYSSPDSLDNPSLAVTRDGFLLAFEARDNNGAGRLWTRKISLHP